ncbi:hypothetical protein HMPREF3156_02442 [Neisseria sp. HMSC06F02]|nr:hypothetical protein HMPREF3156_02442 [Neisseria sp. HMSC06F02]
MELPSFPRKRERRYSGLILNQGKAGERHAGLRLIHCDCVF